MPNIYLLRVDRFDLSAITAENSPSGLTLAGENSITTQFNITTAGNYVFINRTFNFSGNGQFICGANGVHLYFYNCTINLTSTGSSNENSAPLCLTGYGTYSAGQGNSGNIKAGVSANKSASRTINYYGCIINVQGANRRNIFIADCINTQINCTTSGSLFGYVRNGARVLNSQIHNNGSNNDISTELSSNPSGTLTDIEFQGNEYSNAAFFNWGQGYIKIFNYNNIQRFSQTGTPIIYKVGNGGGSVVPHIISINPKIKLDTTLFNPSQIAFDQALSSNVISARIIECMGLRAKFAANALGTTAVANIKAIIYFGHKFTTNGSVDTIGALSSGESNKQTYTTSNNGKLSGSNYEPSTGLTTTITENEGICVPTIIAKLNNPTAPPNNYTTTYQVLYTNLSATLILRSYNNWFNTNDGLVYEIRTNISKSSDYTAWDYDKIIDCPPDLRVNYTKSAIDLLPTIQFANGSITINFTSYNWNISQLYCKWRAKYTDDDLYTDTISSTISTITFTMNLEISNNNTIVADSQFNTITSTGNITATATGAINCMVNFANKATFYLRGIIIGAELQILDADGTEIYYNASMTQSDLWVLVNKTRTDGTTANVITINHDTDSAEFSQTYNSWINQNLTIAENIDNIIAGLTTAQKTTIITTGGITYSGGQLNITRTGITRIECLVLLNKLAQSNKSLRASGLYTRSGNVLTLLKTINNLSGSLSEWDSVILPATQTYTDAFNLGVPVKIGNQVQVKININQSANIFAKFGLIEKIFTNQTTAQFFMPENTDFYVAVGKLAYLPAYNTDNSGSGKTMAFTIEQNTNITNEIDTAIKNATGFAVTNPTNNKLLLTIPSGEWTGEQFKGALLHVQTTTEFLRVVANLGDKNILVIGDTGAVKSTAITMTSNDSSVAYIGYYSDATAGTITQLYPANVQNGRVVVNVKPIQVNLPVATFNELARKSDVNAGANTIMNALTSLN